MKIIHNLNAISPPQKPIALAIGTFDGVHLGHQKIIKQLHKCTKNGGTKYILTFSNHPASLLQPKRALPLITSPNHKLFLLEKYGIDGTILLPFSQDLATQQYQTFLTNLHAVLPFSYLIFGEGASLGKDQQGNETTLPHLGKELGFDVLFLPKETYYHQTISSSNIRQSIEKGELKKIKKWLGRPYSILLPFSSHEVTRENEIQYKWKTECQNLCLLPSGVYGVDLISNQKKIPAICFLQGTKDRLGHTQQMLTLVFDQLISNASYLNIAFMHYLYSEIDPETFHSNPRELLEALSPQPQLS